MKNPKTLIIFLVNFLLVTLFPLFLLAQKKFELGVKFDALTLPVNFGTFIEDGPGYYDIQAKGNITQAAYIDFTYWPLKNWGISLGAGVHSFRREIEYSIPDPSHFTEDTVFYRHDEFKAVGQGPAAALHYRNNRIRVNAGLMINDLSKIEYPYRSSVSSVTIFNPPDVLATVQIEEESAGYGYFIGGNLFQMDFSYEILHNLFCTIGFETALSSGKYYLYTTKISGFTYNTSPEVQLLNDFKMSNAYSAFTVGVRYGVGFGKYGQETQ